MPALKHARTDVAAAAAAFGLVGVINSAVGLALADARGDFRQAFVDLAFGFVFFSAAFGGMAWWYTRRGLGEALPPPPGASVDSRRRTGGVQFLAITWLISVASLFASADPTFLAQIGGSLVGGAGVLVLQHVWIGRCERKTNSTVLREKWTTKGGRTFAPLRYFLAAEDRSTAGGRVQNGGLTQSI